MNKYVCIFVLSVFIASVSQIILKKSADKKHNNIFREYFNIPVIIGYGMMFSSTILTIMAFKKIAFKNGPIIESIGYVFVLILSKIFLGEKLTKNKIIGNAIIILGIIIFYI